MWFIFTEMGMLGKMRLILTRKKQKFEVNSWRPRLEGISEN